jgi:hypothetical protein
MNGGSMTSSGMRYLQIHIPVEQGKDLPGYPLISMFEQVSLICPDAFESGLPTFVLQFIGDFSMGYEQYRTSDAHEVLHVHEHNDRVLVATCHLIGVIPMAVHNTEGVWLQTPSSLLRENGMLLTILGTKNGLSDIRQKLTEIVPGEMKMRITSDIKAEWVAAPQLPERRKEVIELAVEMGYYHTPRKCTQRDIAEVLKLRQGTVAEHLQSAEGSIIQSWADQTKSP